MMKKWICAMLAAAVLLLAGCEQDDYEQAVALYEAGDYAAAVKAFEGLGEYEDSARMVAACRYAMAEELYNAGDLAAAAAAFAELGDFQDSLQRLTACHYGLAQQLLAQDSYLEAAEAFAALGDYADAETHAQDARWLALQDYVSRQAPAVTADGVRVYLTNGEDDPDALNLWAETIMDLGFYTVTDRCGITVRRGQAQGSYVLRTDTQTQADGLTGYTVCSAGGVVELASLTADTELPLTDFTYYGQDVYGNVTERTEPWLGERERFAQIRGMLEVLLEQATVLLEQSGTGYTLQELGLTGLQ